MKHYNHTWGAHVLMAVVLVAKIYSASVLIVLLSLKAFEKHFPKQQQTRASATLGSIPLSEISHMQMQRAMNRL